MDREQYNYLVQRLEKIDSKYDIKLDKILEQTTKTNGRVNALEQGHSEVKQQLETVYSSYKVTKGRDRVIWIASCVVATLIGLVIEHYLNAK